MMVIVEGKGKLFSLRPSKPLFYDGSLQTCTSSVAGASPRNEDIGSGAHHHNYCYFRTNFRTIQAPRFATGIGTWAPLGMSAHVSAAV